MGKIGINKIKHSAETTLHETYENNVIEEHRIPVDEYIDVMDYNNETKRIFDDKMNEIKEYTETVFEDIPQKSFLKEDKDTKEKKGTLLSLP